MNILFISKYAKTSTSYNPSRQFLFSKNLVKKGHNVKLVYSRSNGNLNQSFKGDYKCDNEFGMKTLMINGPLVNFGMNFLRIWSWLLFEYRLFKNVKKLSSFNPDVIIVSSLSVLTFVFGVYFKKRFKIPLIIEVRDLYPITLIEVGNFSRFNPIVVFLGWIEKYGYKNANAIISSLENTESYFAKRVKNSVEFHWLPMGFEPNFYNREVANPDILLIIEKIRHLKKQGRFIVGYAGSIGTANALDTIFNVAIDKEVKNRFIDFVIIGRGPKKEYYESNYKSFNIHFFNSIEKKYLPLVLSECHLLINCWLDKQIYNYGISPNKWIDYMYSARPILLSLNSHSRIFEEADCGWQVSAENSNIIKQEIIKIAFLPKKELDRKGYKGKVYLFEKLNYDYLTTELENVITKVLNKR